MTVAATFGAAPAPVDDASRVRYQRCPECGARYWCAAGRAICRDCERGRRKGWRIFPRSRHD